MRKNLQGKLVAEALYFMSGVAARGWTFNLSSAKENLDGPWKKFILPVGLAAIRKAVNAVSISQAGGLRTDHTDHSRQTPLRSVGLRHQAFDV